MTVREAKEILLLYRPGTADAEDPQVITAVELADPKENEKYGYSAPLIEKTNGTTSVLAALPDGTVVAARQGHWLATSFHPELTEDDRIHRMAFGKAARSRKTA